MKLAQGTGGELWEPPYKEYHRMKWISTKRTEITAGDAEGQATKPKTASPSRQHKEQCCHRHYGKLQLQLQPPPQPGKGHRWTNPKAFQPPSNKRTLQSKKWSRTYHCGRSLTSRIFRKLRFSAQRSD